MSRNQISNTWLLEKSICSINCKRKKWKLTIITINISVVGWLGWEVRVTASFRQCHPSHGSVRVGLHGYCQEYGLVPVFRFLLFSYFTHSNICRTHVHIYPQPPNYLVAGSVGMIQGKVDRTDPVLISLCSSVVQYRSSTAHAESAERPVC